jgi:hypothetical protein
MLREISGGRPSEHGAGCGSSPVAMKLTRHRTENVYHRYAIVSPADLKAAALKLAGEKLGDSREEALANVSSKCLTSGPRTISSVG